MNQKAAMNILFIQVDQLTAESLGAYGCSISQAPNLDALADTGSVFVNAYCNFPLCAPSRFSMASGLLCSKIGAYDNAAEMPASTPTYAHYLRDIGYHTALSGKMHFIGPDQYHGFEQRLTPDLYPADFSWVPNWGNEGKRDTNDPRSVLVSGICERSVQIDFDDLVTFNARQFLYDKVRSGDDRPFFLQVSYTHPHEPYLCRKAYWDLYENVDIPMPRVPALADEEHDPHSLRLLADFGMLGVEFPQEGITRARRAYYGSISYIDQMVGELLTTLDGIGQRENTAIIFTSDHGEMLGERGMWFKKHFFEPSLRIPLFINLPGASSKRVETKASLVDLLPTFMGIATGDTWTSEVEALDGMDLSGFARHSGTAELPERAIYAEYLAESTPAPIFMIRQGEFKYISSPADPPLLFNISNDPSERHNLANDPAHQSTTERFQSEVDAKWECESLTQAIKLSQVRRRKVLQSNLQGERPRWNHQEKPGDQVIWYRGVQGYNEWAFDYLPPK